MGEPPAFAENGEAAYPWPGGHRIGNFELQSVVQRGAVGPVYRAWDHALARPVAIKEYLPSRLAARHGDGTVGAMSLETHDLFERARYAFVDEARTLARCDHPSLVRVLDLIEAHGTAYRVMPWYSGRSLLDVRRRMPGPFGEPALRALIDNLLGALEAYHRVGGVHRGVSPAQVMLLDESRALLLGTAAATRAMRLERADGSAPLPEPLRYAPHEQAAPSDGQLHGPWTDFYALAAVARFCFTGTPPPASAGAMQEPVAATVERLFPGQPAPYSAELLAALDAALAPDIHQRPQTAAQFREWLHAPAAQRAATSVSGSGSTTAREAVPPSPAPAGMAARMGEQAGGQAGGPTVGRTAAPPVAQPAAQQAPPAPLYPRPADRLPPHAPPTSPGAAPHGATGPDATTPRATTPIPTAEPSPPTPMADDLPTLPPHLGMHIDLPNLDPVDDDATVDAHTMELIKRVIDSIPEPVEPALRPDGRAFAAHRHPAPADSHARRPPPPPSSYSGHPALWAGMGMILLAVLAYGAWELRLLPFGPSGLDLPPRASTPVPMVEAPTVPSAGDRVPTTPAAPGTAAAPAVESPAGVSPAPPTAQAPTARAPAAAAVPNATAAATPTPVPSPAPGAAPPSADGRSAGTAPPSTSRPAAVAARPRPPAAEVAPRPTPVAESPREVCGARTPFSLYRCMQQQCSLERWERHPQCVRLAATDTVD